MKIFVILAVAGACVALPQSFIADTPEVQAERQRFFQLYNAAAAAAAAAPDDNVIPRQAVQSSFPVAVSQSRWMGPLAATIPAGVDGLLNPVADTPEVAAAKRAFDAAFQQQLRFTAPQQVHNIRPSLNSIPVQSQKWNGPLASTIPAGLPGSVSQVRNTPEVEAAIAEFTRTYNAAVASTLPALPRQAHAVNRQVFSSPQVVNHQSRASHSHVVEQPRWQGPFAATIPAGLPGSGHQVQETSDVVAARAAFSRAFQQQLSAVHG